MRIMHVMGGGDVGGAKTHIMNMVTGLALRNDVMLLSFRAGPFADEAQERGLPLALHTGQGNALIPFAPLVRCVI